MSTKTHNSPGALNAKVELRRNVIRELREAGQRVDVLDAFCGPVGEMYRHAWHDADSYVGIDEAYVFPDPRRRFVGNNLRIMRNIDLSGFNVFDFDAFGSPWDQMVLLAHLRAWKPGELGAVIFTDGSDNKMRFGDLPHSISWLLNMPHDAKFPPKASTGPVIREHAQAAWLRVAKVRVRRAWSAMAGGKQRKTAGNFVMTYTSLLIEGEPAAEG